MSSKMVIVPNPIITEYIDPLNKLIPEEEVLEVNLDETYNLQVSNATMPPVYYPSNEDRNLLMYYVDVSSDYVPDDYTKKISHNSLGNSEKQYIPLTYVLLGRLDETQFLLAENIFEKNIFKGLKSYSILEYSPVSGKYNEITFFSNGIDMASIVSGNQEYIDLVANVLLSAKRLNESLLSVDTASRLSQTDEIDHGGGYVGYININTNEIESDLQDSSNLRLLEQSVKGSQIVIRDATPIDHVVNALRTFIFRVKKFLQSKDQSWGGVREDGSKIPESKLKKLIREIPIKEIVNADDLVKGNDNEKITLDKEVYDKGTNQDIDSKENKAQKAITSLKGISNAVEATHGKIKRDEPKSDKSKADKDKDEISNM